MFFRWLSLCWCGIKFFLKKIIHVDCFDVNAFMWHYIMSHVTASHFCPLHTWIGKISWIIVSLVYYCLLSCLASTHLLRVTCLYLSTSVGFTWFMWGLCRRLDIVYASTSFVTCCSLSLAAGQELSPSIRYVSFKKFSLTDITLKILNCFAFYFLPF